MMATLEVQVSRVSPIDVAEFIDQQPVGGFQIRLLLTCAAVLFLDNVVAIPPIPGRWQPRTRREWPARWPAVKEGPVTRELLIRG